MAAKAINQNDIPNIVKFYNDSMKAVEKQKIDVKANQKSLRIFGDVTSQIIQFYELSGNITSAFAESSVKVKKSTIESQKIMFDSIGTIVSTINSINGMKFPSMINSQIQAKKLKREVDSLVNIFLGPNGVAGKLDAFNNIRTGGTVKIYDKGKVIKTITTNPVNPTDTVKAFSSLVESISKIVDNTGKMSAKILAMYPLVNLAWPRLIGGRGRFLFLKGQPGIINRYIDLLDSPEFKRLQDGSIKKQIGDVSSNIDSINEVIISIGNTADKKQLIGLRRYGNSILPNLKVIIANIVSLYNDIPNISNTKNIEAIAVVVVELNTIVESLVEMQKVKIHPKRIQSVIQGISVVILEISNFASNTKNTRFAGIAPQIKSIKNIIDNMLGLVGDICLLALASIPLAFAILPAMLTLTLIGLFIKLAIFELNRMTNVRDYTQLQIAMVNITKIVGMILLMVAIVLGTMVLITMSLPELLDNLWPTLEVLGIISIVVLAIAGLAWLINKIFSKGLAQDVFLGLLLMVSLIGVMLLTGGMLFLLAEMGEEFFANNLWMRALGMFAVVGAVTLAIAGLGYLIATLVPGISLFTAGIIMVTISIGAMLLIGVELTAIAEFEFDESNRQVIKDKVSIIIGTARDVMEGLFNGFDDQGVPNSDNSSSFGKFFRSIFKGAAFVVEALAASAVMIFTTISVTMMLLIGLELQSLANYQIDRDAVLGNVNTIMGTANSVIDAIFQPAEGKDTPGGSGFIGALGHFFTGLVDIIELIAAIGKLAISMVAIALVRLLGSELNLIAKFDTSNLGNVTNNVGQIMGVADAVINAIFNPGETQPGNDGPGKKFLGFIKNTLKGIGDVVESVAGIGKVGITLAAVGMVALLARELQTINDISNTVDKTQILDNTDLILTVSDQIVKKVFDATTGFDIDEKKIKTFNTLTDSLELFIRVSNKKADNLEKNINNTIKFIDKIDSVKLENLQTATNMFEKMAEFSKSISGDFAGLADTINDKIMPLLEKLNETFENTNKVIENGASIPSSVPTTTTPAVSAPASGQGVQVGAQAPADINYSAAINEIRQELSKIHDALTDGSQITRIDD